MPDKVSTLWDRMRKAERELFPYQLKAIEFGASKKKVLFAHPTGAGKTLMTIATHERLMEKNQFGNTGRDRVIVVCATKSAMSVWPSELRKWLDIEPVIIKGTPAKRLEIWKNAAKTEKGWFIVTSASMLRDYESGVLGINPELRFWSMIVLEEAHKARNRKSKIFELLSRLSAVSVIELSTTAASRGPQDIWGLMNLLAPRIFPSYWSFVETFCYVENGMFGKEIYGVRNTQALRTLLSNHVITETKEVVFSQHKEPIRQVLWLEMGTKERKIYNALAADLIAEIGDTTIIAPNIMAAETRLRQLTACPAALMGSTVDVGVGPKVEYIINELEEDSHTVILSPFKKGLGLIEAEIRAKGYPNVFQLYGGMDPDLVASTISRFKETQGIILCTIDFAQSFSLDTVSVVYFIGLDADPNDLEQAEGRFLRADSDKERQLVIRYLLCENTIDERYRDIVNTKVRTVDQFKHLKDPKDLKRVLIQTSKVTSARS